MASVANVPYILGLPNPHHKTHNNNKFKFLCRQFLLHRNIWWGSSNTVTYLSQRTPKRNSSTIIFFAANKPSPSTEIRFSLFLSYIYIYIYIYIFFLLNLNCGISSVFAILYERYQGCYYHIMGCF
jgi:hypothetical protein